MTARSFPGGTGAYMSAPLAGATGADRLKPAMTISIWGQITSVSVYRCWTFVGDSTNTSSYWAIGQSPEGYARIEARTSSGFGQANTTNAMELNKPQHMVAVFGSNSSRKIVLNGNLAAAGTSDVLSTPPTDPDILALGGSRDSTPSAAFLGELGHLAIWKRALTDTEISALASGAHPKSIPGLYSFFPLDAGSGSADTDELAAEGPLTVTGSVTYGSFTPPVSAPPSGGAGNPGGGTLVPAKRVWAAPLHAYRKAPVVSIFNEFPRTTVPTPEAGVTRTLFALVAIMPDNDGTTITSVLYGGQPMTLIGTNGYTGSEAGCLVAAYKLTTPSYAEADFVINPSANCWVAARALFAVDDNGATVVVASNNAGGAFSEQEIATEAGSLVLFMAGIQGADGAPATLEWAGATLEGQGPSTASGGSLTTDLALAVASLSITTSATTTKPRVNWSTSDQAGCLVISIPPTSSGPVEPPISGSGVTISVGDTTQAINVPSTKGLAHTMVAQMDEVDGKLTVWLDAQDPVVLDYAGSPNLDKPGQRIALGATFTGRPTVSVVAPGGLIMLAGALSNAFLTPAELEIAKRVLARELTPVVTTKYIQSATPEAITVDISSSVKDPSSWGWELVDVTDPARGVASVASPTSVLIDLSGQPVGRYAVRAQVRSKHPLQPATALTIEVVVGNLQLQTVEASTNINVSTMIDVLLGQTDELGGLLTLLEISDPDNGSAEVVAQKVRYLPDVNYQSEGIPDTFYYFARNSSGIVGQGTVRVTVAGQGTGNPGPQPLAGISKHYRYIGFYGYGGNQGEVHDRAGEWWRFRAAKSGIFQAFMWFSQGSRNNFQFGDAHALGNNGVYLFEFFRYTGQALPIDNIGSSDDRVLIGASRGQIYPGRPTGPASTTFDAYRGTDINAYGSGYPQGLGTGGIRTLPTGSGLTEPPNEEVPYGAYIQARNHGILKGIDGNSTWNSQQRYSGQGWYVVPMGKLVNNVWTPNSIEVVRDEVLLVRYRHMGDSTNHYSMDNTLFLAGGSQDRPDLEYRAPGDDAQAVFFNNGNRGWRQKPHFGQKIDGYWFGQPGMLSLNDATAVPGRRDAYLITNTNWAQQVITPNEGFEGEVVNRIWVWAWKHVGSSGSSVSGNLEVSVWSAPYVPVGGTPQFTNITGWLAIAGSTFKECDGHPHKLKATIGSGKPTLANIFRHGSVAIPDLLIDASHHYAIRVRSSNGAIFGTSAPAAMPMRMNRIPAKEDFSADGVWPRLWKWNDGNRSGRRFTRTEVSSNSGQTWSLFGDGLGDNYELYFPFCLEPKA